MGSGGAPPPVVDPGALAGIAGAPAPPPSPNPTMGPAPAWASTPNGPSTGLSADGGTFTTPGSSAAGSGPALPPVPVKGLAQLIIAGALSGLAGAKGAMHLGGGLAGGAEGYAQAQQQKVQNAQFQQQLNFESVKAGDSHIAARDAAQAADDAHEESKVKLDAQHQAVQEFAEEHGASPKLVISGTNSAAMHAQATAGLGTLASQNPSGKIPQVITTNSPATADDPNHEINVYTTTPTDVTSNNNGTLAIINQERATRNLPAISQPDLQVLAGQKRPGDWKSGAAEMANDAQSSLYTIPTLSKADSSEKQAAENAAIEAGLQQKLDTATANPLTKTTTINILKANLAAFQSASSHASTSGAQGESSVIAGTSSAKAAAGAQEASAKTVAQNTGAAGAAKTAQAATEEAAKTAAKAAADQSTQQWNPKTGADEKKKAELAENIAFNANEVNNLIAKRPDLVGTVAGRYTNVQQMMGNNDPDISAIGTHIHNIAMANSGVHGFRSQEGVAETEKLLLNGFKNGPQAVAGAMKANVSSVQTFIDNARPAGYATHSQQGGAGSFYASRPPSGLPTGSVKMQVPGGAPHWMSPDKLDAAKKMGAVRVN